MHGALCLEMLAGKEAREKERQKEMVEKDQGEENCLSSPKHEPKMYGKYSTNQRPEILVTGSACVSLCFALRSKRRRKEHEHRRDQMERRCWETIMFLAHSKQLQLRFVLV